MERFATNPYLHKSSALMERSRIILTRNIRKIIHKPVVDIVYSLTKYNTIKTDKNCGGYFDRHNEVIAFNTSSVDIFSTLFHELGHWVHSENGYDYEGDNTISHAIIEEQEVEAFACRIHLDIFGIYKPKEEWAYYSKEDFLFLSNWYEGYKINDLA